MATRKRPASKTARTTTTKRKTAATRKKTAAKKTGTKKTGTKKSATKKKRSAAAASRKKTTGRKKTASRRAAGSRASATGAKKSSGKKVATKKTVKKIGKKAATKKKTVTKRKTTTRKAAPGTASSRKTAARKTSTRKTSSRAKTTRRTSAAGSPPKTSIGRSPRLTKDERAKAAFGEAVERVAQGFLFDAVPSFRDAIDADPKGPLADDALFNIGGIYLQMGLVKDAEEAFTELIGAYPDATISATAGAKEFGRTAAKAFLGRLRSRLAAGDQHGARADLMALAGYTDSWVVTSDGGRRSFHDLGVEAFG